MKRKGQELNEFISLLNKKADGAVKIQTHWAVVQSVDWEAKTMVVKDLVDDLEFYDVLLGLGSFYRKPKVGTSCLIGIILNNEAASFLIEVEEVEEVSVAVLTNELTINESGFLVKRGNETLKAVLNDLITEVNKIIVINGTTINVAAMEVIKQRLNTVLTD